MGDFSFLGQFTGKSRVAPRKIIQEKVFMLNIPLLGIISDRLKWFKAYYFK
jgi:hypothetical protein